MTVDLKQAAARARAAAKVLRADSVEALVAVGPIVAEATDDGQPGVPVVIRRRDDLGCAFIRLGDPITRVLLIGALRRAFGDVRQADTAPALGELVVKLWPGPHADQVRAELANAGTTIALRAAPGA